MSARQVVSVLLTDICPDSDQPRKEFGEGALAALSQSLAAQGQLHPLLVYQENDRQAYQEGCKLQLLDGERRCRCALALKWKEIDVVIVPRPETDVGTLEKSLTTSIQREDLNPMDGARAFARLIEMDGGPAARVAERLGVSPVKISKLMALLRLPESVQKMVTAGELAATTAYEIARLDDPAAQERLAGEAVKKKLSRDVVAKRVDALKAGKAKPKKKAPRIEARLPGGRSIGFSGQELSSVDDLISWIDELSGKARKARKKFELQTFLRILGDEAKKVKQSGPEQGQGGVS